MAQTFNSPPGWPKPPEGWTPPPGWAPDPSWPAAPEGWQFWTEDPFATAVAAENTFPSQRAQQPHEAPTSTEPGNDPDQQATQTMGTPVTQAMPAQPGQPTLYTYAPSAGLEQPGASPYNPHTPQQQGGYPGGAAGGYGPGGGFPGGPHTGPGVQGGPGGPPPKPRNTTTMIAVAVVAVLVLGGLVWGISSLLGGGDESPTAGEPSTTATSAEPTDEATSDEPTEEATSDEPTDDATTDDGGGAPADGTYTDLGPGEPAVVLGASGVPVVEVRLLEATTGWQPEGSSAQLCGDPENAQYLGLQLEFTVLPAMADEDPPTYTYIGWELGALAGDHVLETSAFATGLFCVGSEEGVPSEMQPGETYTGLSVLDVPDDVTAVTWEDMFDFTGEAAAYRWVLADQ